MARRIRITSETYDYSPADEMFLDLPNGWDDWTEDDRREYLHSAAMDALATRAGSGAVVVDENGNEIED